MDFPAIEWCRTIEGFSSNIFFESLVNATRAVAKDLLEICHRTGDMKLVNVSFAKLPILTRWPSGDFRTEYRFFDALDDNIFNISHDAILAHVSK